MTAVEFRLKKMRELEALLEKLAALEEGPLKRELKERFSRTYLRQIERITGILDNPALARLCSGQSLFRSDRIGTELQILDLTRFLDANRNPPRIKSGAGFRQKTLERYSIGKGPEAWIMKNSDVVDFGAPAILRKWRSINNQRALNAKWPHPYLIVEGTLDECIEKFMMQPPSQRHLYEIHALPQAEIVSSVMSAEHIFELGRLREFL